MPFSRRLSFAGLWCAAGIVTAAISLAAFGARLWWPLDLASSFRAQYFVALVVLGAGAALLRRRRSALAIAAVALLNLLPLLPLFTGGGTAGADGPVHRAVCMNVHVFNRHRADVLAWLRDADADLIVLLETSDRWLAALAPLRASHPHVVAEPRSDAFGIAVFSRYALVDARVVSLGPAMVPSVFGTVQLAGQEITLLATHPVPPWGGRLAAMRDEQIDRICSLIAGAPRPLLLLGDLNTTPFAPSFEKLLDATGLRDSAAGFGYQPTWPAWCPPLAIPLDHCLHSTDIDIVDRRTGPALGSDHRPLLVDFRVRTP